MRPDKTSNLLHKKGKHKPNKKTTCRMEENIFKRYNWKWLNFQNIWTAYTAQEQNNKQLNQKMGRSK